MDVLLDASESVDRITPIQDLRFCITHANFPSPFNLERCTKLRFCADVQPAWLYKDGHTPLKVLGPERLPEVARQIAKFVKLMRGYADDVQGQFSGEFGELRREFMDVQEDLVSIQSNLRSGLLERKQGNADAAVGSLRKSQVGTGDRSEKIRTYNFPQDRITDHRINESFQNIKAILDGDLAKLVGRLQQDDKMRRLSGEVDVA